MSREKNRRIAKYYMDLPYTVHIEEQKDEDGHFFYAYIDELGKYTCYGVGKSIEEALKSLEVAKEVTIEDILAAGKAVPLPKEEEEVLPSGRFVVRTSPRLHAQLTEQARKEGISLNLLVNILLSQNIVLRKSEREKEKANIAKTADERAIHDKPITINPNDIAGKIERKIRIGKKGPFEGIVRKGSYYRKVS